VCVLWFKVFGVRGEVLRGFDVLVRVVEKALQLCSTGMVCVCAWSCVCVCVGERESARARERARERERERERESIYAKKRQLAPCALTPRTGI
jgi:hypothetical protein